MDRNTGTIAKPWEGKWQPTTTKTLLLNYACVTKLGELMRKQGYLEVKEVPLGDGSTQVHVYVRRKAGSASGR